MRRQRIPVVILCGGMGTRLREETEYRPKPMVEIGGRPILWHIMKMYERAGFTDFVLCLGYKGDVIKEYFRSYETMNGDFTVQLGRPHSVVYHDQHVEEWSVTLTDTGQQSMTGARIKRAARYVDAERFMVTYGDGVADIDIGALLDFHRRAGTMATVTGVRPPSRFGELTTDGSLVQQFKEKPQADEGLVNGGFFVFERQFLDYLTDDPACVLEHEPLERLAGERQLSVYQHGGFWHSMDTFRDFQYLNQLWNTDAAPWKTW
jgi:glucose-1-phosphate cytidylyltransferase